VGAYLLPPRSFAPLRMTVGKGKGFAEFGRNALKITYF
jgi:hypothetical protein